MSPQKPAQLELFPLAMVYRGRICVVCASLPCRSSRLKLGIKHTYNIYTLAAQSSLSSHRNIAFSLSGLYSIAEPERAGFSFTNETSI